MTEIFRQCKDTPEGQAATHLKHLMSPSEEKSEMEGGMFNGCNSLENMSNMFSGCRSLQAIPPIPETGITLDPLITLSSHCI
jgi:hypothetical protein